MRFDQVARVLTRSGQTVDALNVPTKTWDRQPGGTPVMTQRTSGHKVATPEGSVTVADWLIFADPAPPWTADDRLEIDGVVYLIADVDDDVSSRGHHSESLARRIGTVS